MNPDPMKEDMVSTQAVRGFWATLFFVFAVVIFFISIATAFRVSSIVDTNSREALLTRVKTIAHLVNVQDILELSATSADVEKTEYQSLKEVMKALRLINSDARFVYLMGSNGQKLFFYVDSEEPQSDGYSPPGEIYEETTPLQFQNYYDGISFTEGPYKDSWGSWVSGYAPVYDDTGKIIAIVGMDVNAHDWQASLRFIVILILLVGLLLAGAFVLAGLFVRRSSVLLALFERSNKKLRFEQENLKETLLNARIAQWTLSPKLNDMSFDAGMYLLTGIQNGTHVTRDMFENILSEESRKEFHRILEIATDHREQECSATVSVVSPNASARLLKLSMQIKYGAGDIPLLITGTAQDVST